MYMFGEFTDPYGPFGNMPEIPTEEDRRGDDPDDLLREGCLRLSCMLSAIILGIVLLLIISFVL